MANSINSANGERMSRRQLLSVTVAGSIAAATTPSFAADPVISLLEQLHDEAAQTVADSFRRRDSELSQLILTYSSLQNAKAKLNVSMDLIWDRSDRPSNPEVHLREMYQRELDYPPEHRELRFACVADLDRYYNQNPHGFWMAEKTEARKRVDWETMKARLQEQRAALDTWFENTGWNQLEEEWERVADEIDGYEERICDLPCMTFEDVLLKVQFTRDWLSDDELEWSRQHAAVLQSMVGMLTNSAI